MIKDSLADSGPRGIKPGELRPYHAYIKEAAVARWIPDLTLI